MERISPFSSSTFSLRNAVEHVAVQGHNSGILRKPVLTRSHRRRAGRNPLRHLAQAELLARRLIAISSQAYGPSHPDLMEGYRVQGAILRRHGRYLDADASLLDLPRFTS